MLIFALKDKHPAWHVASCEKGDQITLGRRSLGRRFLQIFALKDKNLRRLFALKDKHPAWHVASCKKGDSIRLGRCSDMLPIVKKGRRLFNTKKRACHCWQAHYKTKTRYLTFWS
jgi:hypothetical protein